MKKIPPSNFTAMAPRPPLIDSHQALTELFGYQDFRPGQETIVETILKGRDVLAIMPTGAGKSLCYQLPAAMLPGLTIVISPLIALMVDQVNNLLKRGIPAASIHSGLTPSAKTAVWSQVNSQQLKLLYLSPETFQEETVLNALNRLPLSLICIDEAHCLSSWGKHFRPCYRTLGKSLAFLTARPPIVALTASATHDVRDDIISLLNMKNPIVRTFSFDRPNLYFEVRRTRNKIAELKALLAKYRGECGIIYTLTRQSAENLSLFLSKIGYNALVYHAGLDKDIRTARQEAWLRNDCPLMIATNAFGMGIDKPDVRFVIHYNMPGTMEGYYQEAGRAGRDGSPSDCILLVNVNDLKIHDNFLRQDLKHGRNDSLASDEQALRTMIDFAGGRRCLRRAMLSYFGEPSPAYCGRCSVCQSLAKDDLTALADGAAESAAREADLCRYLFIFRRRLSEKLHKPAYKIFPDTIIQEMARQKPTSFPALLAISNISPLQVLRFGRHFLKELRHWPF